MGESNGPSDPGDRGCTSSTIIFGSTGTGVPGDESDRRLEFDESGPGELGKTKFGEVDSGPGIEVAELGTARGGSMDEETARLNMPVPWIGGGGGTRRRSEGCSGGGVNGGTGACCCCSLAGPFLTVGNGATKRGIDGESLRHWSWSCTAK